MSAMLTRNEIKHIRSLALKKVRDAEGLFLAEGPKVVGELLGHYPCSLLAATSDYLSALPRAPRADDIREISAQQLQQASLLKTPHDVLAVFVKPQADGDLLPPSDALSLALDDIQDPGNMGTIIRTADWFGIEHIYCSPHTADAYAPKVVQATMGALARTHIHYTPLPPLLHQLPEDFPVMGTFLDGTDLYGQSLPLHGLLVMGNEGTGISPQVAAAVSHRLLIPSYPPQRSTSQSLNVAAATAIICAELRRRRRRGKV